MSTTLLSLKDKYYMYDGDKNIEEQGLIIGSYELAWLADLAISYLLDNINQTVYNNMNYFGIYRDDGIAIFKGSISQRVMTNWLNTFQREIESISGKDFLKFTAVLWKPNEQKEAESNNAVQINSDPFLPYLDTELFWGLDETLQFKVHLKPNQQLKYLKHGKRAHTGLF